MDVRVVIEYVHKGYSLPLDPITAYGIDARVTFANVTVPAAASNLDDLRAGLEDMGLEMRGAHPIETHRAGRWCPTWREVWATNRGAA